MSIFPKNKIFPVSHSELILTLNIPTALKGWVGLAPQGRGALHIIII